MSTIQNNIFKRDGAFRADLGDYRELKLKGQKDEIHSVRIETGEIWDLDHGITYGLALDGFVFLRKERIVAEVNQERYDKIDFLLAFGDMPDVPDELPALDQDRQLFKWLCDRKALVMIYGSKPNESFMGKVEVVNETSCRFRLVDDELLVADEPIELVYSSVHVLVVRTHLLRIFDRYLGETEQI
jgi:hypothetical protein